MQSIHVKKKMKLYSYLVEKRVSQYHGATE